MEERRIPKGHGVRLTFKDGLDAIPQMMGPVPWLAEAIDAEGVVIGKMMPLPEQNLIRGSWPDWAEDLYRRVADNNVPLGS